MVVASARANIALVKYWGKRARKLNVPSAGSLSLTLAALETRTSVRLVEEAEQDSFRLDGQQSSEKARHRVSAFLELVRRMVGRREHAHVESINAFPTGAGLASSASAFAALAKAASEAYGLDLALKELSILARQGSGSAARSIFGGWVRMYAGFREDGLDAYAVPLEGLEMELSAVIAVVQGGEKQVGSTEGMEQTRTTSPYHDRWLQLVNMDLEACVSALQTKDFERLAEIIEGNCLAMHADAMAARPGVIYFSGATLWAIHQIRALRASGTPVCFTVDAGPHVVALVHPEHAASVASVLGAHPEMDRVIITTSGDGVRTESGDEAV